MNNEAVDILARARLIIAQQAPYLMTAVYGLIPIEDEHAGIGTFSVTQDMRMYYNPKFVLEVGRASKRGDREGDERIAAIIVHEVFHVMREHHSRFPKKMHPEDAYLAGIAMDLAINPDLRKAGWKLPNFCAYPEKYNLKEGHTAEEYFRMLKQNPPPMPPTITIVFGDGEGGGEGQEGGGDGGGNNTPGVGSGACGSCATGKDPKDKDGGAGRTPVDVQGIIKKVASDIRNYTAQHGRGRIPGSLIEWANDQLKPSSVHWTQEIAHLVRRVSGKIRSGGMDFSLRRPSKRSYARGMLRPGLIQRVPEVAIILDTSGSMGREQLISGKSEACAVLKATGIDDAWYMEADTQAAFMKRVRVSEIPSLPIHGRGGTDFTGPLKVAMALKPKPDLIFYFTDGDGYAPPEAPKGVEVIWGIVNSYYNKAPVPWGHTVFIKD